MNKKIISIVLALCMVVSCVVVGSVSATAASTSDSSVSAPVESATVAASTGLMSKPQDGVILHAWDWSFNNIKSRMKQIADSGYTSVQTSVIQQSKEGTKGKTNNVWWLYYQPCNFVIDNTGNSALGTKAEFTAMCTEAHKYGIHVIVDVVANHLGNNTGYDKSNAIPSNIRNNSNYWHDQWNIEINYDNRYSITHGSMGGLPDLNTENGDVQGFVKTFLRECIDCGADGFRFDAAKHIGVPNDSAGCNSNFWPTVLNDANSYYNTKGYFKSSGGLYSYGEILWGTGGPSISQYTQYMSVTDNVTGNDIRGAVAGHNASGAAASNYKLGAGASKSVLWAESHDTYAGDKKESTGVSQSDINKTWALVGSRNQATALYFARTKGYRTGNIGDVDNTSCFNKEVVEVNKFHNYFHGQSEYLASSGNIAYNERGTSGVVLVNCNGTSQSVNVAAHKMAAGTYKDQVSGNSFTVSGGQIKGQIGSTGIAVVYNAETGPSVNANPGSQNYKTDTLNVTLSYSDATSGTYTIDNGTATSFTGSKTITIGSGLAIGTVTTIKVTATDGTKTASQTYTYTKVDPNATETIYYDNSSTNWSPVYCYMWKNGVENSAYKQWPGELMKSEGNNIYSYDVPDGGYDMVIFNAGDMTGDTTKQTTDLNYPGGGKIYKNGSWENYGTTQPTTSPVPKVLIGDVDQNGRVSIKDATMIQLYLVDKITLTGNALEAADTNRDKSVTIKDVTSIQRYLAKFNDSGNKCGTYTDGTTPTDPTVPTNPDPVTYPTDPSTEPTSEPDPGTKTVLFSDNQNWGTVYCYAWNDGGECLGGWPGAQMSEIGTNDYGEKQFSIQVPTSATQLIFSNGAGAQTVDVPFDQSKDGWYVTGWSDGKATVGSWPDGPVPDTSINGGEILFTDNYNWGTVYCYAWGNGDMLGGWPGTRMQEAGTNDYGEKQFKISIPSGTTGIIFNNGNGTQTVDISYSGGVTGYYISGWDNGKATVGSW